MAASVSTRVVSWKEAADSHESVASDALVMPISSGRPSAGFLPSSTSSRLVSAKTFGSTRSPGRNSDSPGSCTTTRRVICRTISSMCLSWIDTPWSRYTFWTCSTRYCCVSRMPLISSSSFGSRAPSTIGSPASISSPSVDLEAGDGGHRVGVLVAVVADDGDDPALALVLADPDDTGGAGQGGLALRAAGLEQLDDAGQTAGDVAAGDAAGVEGPHGQLRARLADRLGGDDADGLAELDRLAGGQRQAVAGARDAELGVVGQRRAAPAPGRPSGSSRSGVHARRRRPSVPALRRPVPSRQLHVVGERPAVQPGLEVGRASAGRLSGRDVLDPDAADRCAGRRSNGSSSLMISSWATSTRRRVR